MSFPDFSHKPGQRWMLWRLRYAGYPWHVGSRRNSSEYVCVEVMAVSEHDATVGALAESLAGEKIANANAQFNAAYTLQEAHRDAAMDLADALKKLVNATLPPDLDPEHPFWVAGRNARATLDVHHLLTGIT